MLRSAAAAGAAPNRRETPAKTPTRHAVMRLFVPRHSLDRGSAAGESVHVAD